MLRTAGSMVRRTSTTSSRNLVNFWAASQNGVQKRHPLIRQPTPASQPSTSAINDLLDSTKQLTITNTTQQYKLPGMFENKPAILDPLMRNSIELPSGLFIPKISPNITKQEITAPSQTESVKKEAKSDLKQRRRHMNKHKLKKLRKRMKFVYMKLEQKKMKRKQLALKQECDDILNSAKNWNPLEEISQDLEKARAGGFSIDVFEKKSL